MAPADLAVFNGSTGRKNELILVESPNALPTSSMAVIDGDIPNSAMKSQRLLIRISDREAVRDHTLGTC